ncbi:MAG: two-component system, OmpR family, alkaline phosphatase synthesis response regulator PhoP [Bacteroidota bacterium]|nr:two-component system, OmpR family, alkaline phosphatase synthesis response regulator PhoP [Bacteroidota bacterium]
MKNKILIIEDDENLGMTIKDRLIDAGYETVHVTDADEGIEHALNKDYSLIILDVILKDKSGLDICRQVRNRGSDIPVLILTALGQIEDKIVGFKLGADDYLTKPFQMLELLLRIEALLRRRTLSTDISSIFQFSDIEVDFTAIEVRKNGEKLDMTSKEFELLKYLIFNRGRTVSRDELLNEVWGYEKSPTTRTIDTHILWLRQKLEEDPRNPKFIVKVHGYGYKFAPFEEKNTD